MPSITSPIARSVVLAAAVAGLWTPSAQAQQTRPSEPPPGAEAGAQDPRDPSAGQDPPEGQESPEGQDTPEGHAFLAAPQVDLNRVYRVDRASGEMGACQYATKDATVGVTLCFPAGEGAGPLEAGDYDLVASRHPREQGVYRVDRRSGRMSVCYVLGEQVVCTPPAR